MEKLSVLKSLLEIKPSDTSKDDVLMFYLDSAKDIICDIRNTSDVESKYNNTQIKIAVELFNKRGIEGENSHSELGVSRTYASASVSESLLAEITPRVKTPYSKPSISFHGTSIFYK